MNLLGWVAIAVSVIVILVIILVLALQTRRLNRRRGGSGPVLRSRLTCPKCHQSFDYEWVVGAALTAVRLGSRRYMACPLCHKWSTFDVAGTVIPPPPDPSP